MPRVKPIVDSETQVGRRLMQARKEAMITRAALAVKIGISTDRLFAYENGRAKLPWGVANKVCEILDISQDWLAGRLTGAFGVYVAVDMSDLLQEQIDRTPFSEIFEQYFLPRSAEPRMQIFLGMEAKSKEFNRLVSLIKNTTGLENLKHLERLQKIYGEMQREHQRMFRRPK